MFLYDKKDRSIDVFSLNPDSLEISSYRREQMKKIPLNESVFYMREIVSTVFDKPILFRKNLYSDIIPQSELIGRNRSLNCNTDLADAAKTLEYFYTGEYDDRPIARVESLAKMRYLLIASKDFTPYEYDENRVIDKIANIIEIPKSLYLLQLLQQEKFFEIREEDISEQLELFDFSYIDNMEIDELQKMDTCGVTNNAYSRIVTKADNDKHILQLLRK